ncbi:MAG TPA: PqqD family protein [Bacteroidales bacterium]
MKLKSNIALSESGFIFNPNTGESFTLNPTGQQIIELIKEGKEFDEISQYFLENFETEESIFEKDFEDFMHMLTSYQMLETSEES